MKYCFSRVDGFDISVETRGRRYSWPHSWLTGMLQCLLLCTLWELQVKGLKKRLHEDCWNHPSRFFVFVILLDFLSWICHHTGGIDHETRRFGIDIHQMLAAASQRVSYPLILLTRLSRSPTLYTLMSLWSVGHSPYPLLLTLGVIRICSSVYGFG